MRNRHKGVLIGQGNVDTGEMSVLIEEMEIEHNALVSSHSELVSKYNLLLGMTDNIISCLLNLKESIEEPESDKGKKGYTLYLKRVYELVGEYLNIRKIPE